ncbi:MAG TPA: SRPBCC family protein [Microthrixaceae bacterium]|nr:SRPBCC family protein [Microthrixaceae bacterium]
MPHYRATVPTPWPAPRAFGYLCDLENFAEWDPGVKRSVSVAGDGAVGSTFDVTVGGVGRDLTLRYEIVSLDPPGRAEVRAETATLLSVDVMTFEPAADGGCHVTYDADLSLKGAFRIGNPFLGVVFARIGDRAAAGLRRALQGEAA